MTTEGAQVDFYNEIYKAENFFRYRRRTCAAYVSALVSFCGLRAGASVLDVGCGQGFFSYLFYKHGMRVCGVDISETGIRMAERLYGQPGLRFLVLDAQTDSFPEEFDCIFVRSCSLYNAESFSFRNEVTDNLLKHLKVGGTLIFAYNSNFSGKVSSKWRYHSMQDVRQHFRKYPDAQVFFVNKVATFALRRFSINSVVTHLSALLSEKLGFGGDILCVLNKSESSPPSRPEATTPEPCQAISRGERAT